jgi:hypothetical protein
MNDEANFCSQCEATVSPSAKFCSSCGYDLQNSSTKTSLDANIKLETADAILDKGIKATGTTLKRGLKLFYWVIFFFVLVIGGTMGKELGKAFIKGFNKPTPQSVEKAIILGFQKAAKQFNENGPKMIDEITRWDRMSVGPGARATYHFTILHQVNLSQFKEKIRPVIIKKICNEKKMKSSMKHGGVFIYSYSSKGNNDIVSLEFDKNDCSF